MAAVGRNGDGGDRLNGSVSLVEVLVGLSDSGTWRIMLPAISVVALLY